MVKDQKKTEQPTSQVATESTAESAATPAQPTPSKKPEPKRELDPANSFDDFVGFMRENEKANKFMMIYMLAHEGLKPEAFQDELKRRQFLADFEAWKKAGEPGISMPKLPKSDIKFPTALYRIRDRMVDYLYVYYSDGSEEGIKYIPKYEQIENPETGQMEDSKIKVGQTETYDLKFDAKIAKQLIDEYNKLAPPGTNPLQLYVWVGNAKHSISEANFCHLQHDAISEHISTKKALN